MSNVKKARKSTPDFSSSFDLVKDQLDKTERRLRKGKTVEAGKSPAAEIESGTAAKPSAFQNSKRENLLGTKEQIANHLEAEELPKSGEPQPSAINPNASTTSLRPQRERRRNLTLKVLESNEIKFNRLFHQLQLSGNPIRKQDLADEALQLLFTAYQYATS